MNIKKLKESVDVQGLLENYEFEKITDDGDWVKARCPYHDDSNPSFCVRKSDTYFHCWSCKESGDAVKLIMDLDNVDFKEATIKLAALCGYSENSDANMEYLKKTWLDKHEKVANEDVPLIMDNNTINLNNWAAQLFVDSLPKSAFEYLESRCFGSDAILKYKLGYYPDNFVELAAKDGFNGDGLVRAGFLVGESNFELFRNRIMFPIYDMNDNVVAFSGRKTIEEQEPKYIANPNSDYYKKSFFLYGLQNVVRERATVIVEGNLDCVRLGCGGFNTLAQLGSTLTYQQCHLLKMINDVCILMLDGDEAGRKATYKAIPRLAIYGIRSYVVELPEGSDPDTFLLNNGRDKLQAFMDKPDITGLGYYLDKSADRDENEILCEWLKVVSVIKNTEDKNYYINLMSQIFDVSSSIIESELKKVGA